MRPPSLTFFPLKAPNDLRTLHEVKTRSDMHILRKVWHMGGVFLLFLSYRLLPESLIIPFLVVLTLWAVTVDVVRLRSRAINELILIFFRPLMRQNEVQGYAGTTYLLIGVLAITLIFPKVVVSLTLLFLAFADPVASFVGIKYGKDKIFGHKSIQGFMAAFFVCVIVTLSYFYYRGIMVNRMLVVGLLSGLVGALAELIPVGKVDDNLTLPMMSAVGLWILFYFFNLL